jgi:hypothetical protein
MIHIITTPTQPYHKSKWCCHLLRHTQTMWSSWHITWRNNDLCWAWEFFWVRCSGNIKLIPVKLHEYQPRGLRNYPKNVWPLCSTPVNSCSFWKTSKGKTLTSFSRLLQVSHLSLPWASKLYCIGSLHQPEHSVTAAMLREMTKETACVMFQGNDTYQAGDPLWLQSGQMG